MSTLIAVLLSCLYFVHALDFREYICNSKHKRDVSSKRETERDREEEFCLLLFWVALISKFESVKKAKWSFVALY